MNVARQIQFDSQSFEPLGNSRGTHSDNSGYQNPGEWLLRLGRLIRFLVRHGAELRQIAQELGAGEKLCVLARTFVAAPDCLKLRALVEDWSLTRIHFELGELAAASCLSPAPH